MTHCYKIDDPTINKFEISNSQIFKIQFKRTDCPFNDNLRVVVSLDKRIKTRKQVFLIGEGVTINGDWAEILLSGKDYKCYKKIFIEFDGYGNGSRIMEFEIIINKSAL